MFFQPERKLDFKALSGPFLLQEGAAQGLHVALKVSRGSSGSCPRSPHRGESSRIGCANMLSAHICDAINIATIKSIYIYMQNIIIRCNRTCDVQVIYDT